MQQGIGGLQKIVLKTTYFCIYKKDRGHHLCMF